MPASGPTTALPDVLHLAGLTADVLAQVDHLVVGCGGFARELVRFTGGASSVKDSAGQRVTEADRLIDSLLRERLTQLVPGSTGYSEEGGRFGAEREGLRVRWSIDPVDGTRPALLGGAFGVSVGALVCDGRQTRAAVGWLYAPTLATLYRGILTGDFAEARLNGDLVRLPKLAPLENCYLGVSSNWRSTFLTGCSLKLSAAGATSIHLTQLLQPGSDVAAVALTRYRAYDVAGALVPAVAAGCAVYPLEMDRGGIASEPLDPLAYLAGGARQPEALGPPVLVCRPEVADRLRERCGSPEQHS
ncbi:MAG: inositol monophosphatase family protein [Armatimonadota bacterium]